MKKILVIEDEQDIRADILKILKYEGFEAIGAENGRIGVQLAKEHLPDLIICDIMMPELNGYHVLAEIRSQPATATIPFIFLTAMATSENLREGMRLGADDYLPKPFTITELMATIQSRLERHAALSKQLEELHLTLGVGMPTEMRNALTGIIGFAEFLTKPDMLPGLGEIAEIGKVIYQSGLALQRIVENYLIYVELKLLEYKPKNTSDWLTPEEIDTEHFLAFFSKYKAKEANRSQDLRLHLADAKIAGSTKSFQKIVIELLDNALKFSKPGQSVRVESIADTHHFLLKIIDQGHGMSQEQIARVYGVTQQEEDFDVTPDLGMGLLIVRLLAKLQGGDLNIESTLNQGTTVTVMFNQNA
jgi:two-component system sensor histidine kinase/response regulator